MYRKPFFTGIIYGFSIALMSGGITALCTFLSGLEFKEALVLGAQVGALMIPTAIGASVFALIVKKVPEIEAEEEQDYPETSKSEVICEVPVYKTTIQAVFDRLVDCALFQVELTYRDGVAPTRKYVTSSDATNQNFTQAEWNSSRALLVAMGIVVGQQWIMSDLSVVAGLLERVRFDEHGESAGVILVPVINSRSYQRLPIALPLINGSYLTAPPQQRENSQFSG